MEPETGGKKKTTGKKRLTRILTLSLIALLVVAAVRSLTKQESIQKALITSLGLSVKEKVSEFSENVLGTAVKFLPDAPDWEGERDGQEIEPIKQPAEKIRQQTEALLESIKKLPQDQVRAIKKQIYQDFCQRLIEEDDD